MTSVFGLSGGGKTPARVGRTNSVAPMTPQKSDARPSVEEIQRKSRVREWAPQKAPRIRAGVTKKDQKAELKKNQTRRCYAEKISIFFQTTGRHPPGARRETTEVKTRKC